MSAQFLTRSGRTAGRHFCGERHARLEGRKGEGRGGGGEGGREPKTRGVKHVGSTPPQPADR